MYPPLEIFRKMPEPPSTLDVFMWIPALKNKRDLMIEMSSPMFMLLGSTVFATLLFPYCTKYF